MNLDRTWFFLSFVPVHSFWGRCFYISRVLVSRRDFWVWLLNFEIFLTLNFSLNLDIQCRTHGVSLKRHGGCVPDWDACRSVNKILIYLLIYLLVVNFLYQGISPQAIKFIPSWKSSPYRVSENVIYLCNEKSKFQKCFKNALNLRSDSGMDWCSTIICFKIWKFEKSNKKRQISKFSKTDIFWFDCFARVI